MEIEECFYSIHEELVIQYHTGDNNEAFKAKNNSVSLVNWDKYVSYIDDLSIYLYIQLIYIRHIPTVQTYLAIKYWLVSVLLCTIMFWYFSFVLFIRTVVDHNATWIALIWHKLFLFASNCTDIVTEFRLLVLSSVQPRKGFWLGSTKLIPNRWAYNRPSLHF